MLQWYATVPAAENVCVNVPPTGMLPLSKLPSSAVTVCVVASLLVQVTVVPGFTVKDAVTKAKFFIETELLVPLVFPPVVSLLLLQALNITKAKTENNRQDKTAVFTNFNFIFFYLKTAV